MDYETGLYFYRARYYDSKVGRFVTKDPIGFGGGDYNLFVYTDSVGKPGTMQTNLYQYAGNNPVNFIDPMGLLEWGVGGTVGPVTVGYNSWNTNTSVSWNTSLAIGGGGKVCFENPFKDESSKCKGTESPWWLNVGINQHLGISTNNNRMCINIGWAQPLFINIPIWVSR